MTPGQLAIADPGELLFNQRMRDLGNRARWSDPDLGREWNNSSVSDTEVRRRWAAAEVPPAPDPQQCPTHTEPDADDGTGEREER